MRTNQKAADHGDEPGAPQQPDRTPVRGFATPWLRGNPGRFYVNLPIVGPKAEEPQRCLPLGAGEADNILQTASDLVETAKQQLGRQPPPVR